MDEFVDSNGVLFTLVLAVQGVFVLVFLIAPLGGFLFTKGVQKKADLTLILGVMLLTFNGLFAGITYFLQNRVAEGTVSDQTAAILGLIVGVAIAGMVGMYLRSLFIYQPPTALDLELEMLAQDEGDDEEDSGTIFDQRRRERRKKRAQRGRR
jgi:hypothetical protein